MAENATSILNRLESLKMVYGNDAASRKLELVRKLEGRRLGRARDVLRFHEILCFLWAYPDDRDLLQAVERVLAGFDRRGDLRKYRTALADTGVAGTTIQYRFFWPTARWLARRWPDRLSIDWAEFENRHKLDDFLGLLLPYSESPALDEFAYRPREWIERLKGPDDTDASFLVRRFESLRSDSFGRERLFEQFDVPIRIAPGPDTPARTRAKRRTPRIVFQKGPLSRSRPDLLQDIKRPPRAVRAVPPREARRLIDLAREAMVTRSRDLDAFAYADKDDVRIVDCGQGLQFVCLGAVPERRLMLESVYGYLTIKNGVPIGYVLSSSLFGSTEIAYNVFDTYRGAEAATVFGRVLAMVHHLFLSDAFSVDPYQLGHGNAEGLQSGAWWFYYKLGFRPVNPEIRRVLRGELRRMKADRRHRSSIPTLEKLASDYVYLYLKRPRNDTMGQLSMGNIGLRISSYLATRFGADREGAIRTCSKEAARLLGVRSLRRFKPGERLAWERWSPLVMALPGVERWPAAERRALARVVRAKGGRRESDFVRLFDRHRRLRRAVLRLARDAG